MSPRNEKEEHVIAPVGATPSAPSGNVAPAGAKALPSLNTWGLRPRLLHVAASRLRQCRVPQACPTLQSIWLAARETACLPRTAGSSPGSIRPVRAALFAGRDPQPCGPFRGLRKTARLGVGGGQGVQGVRVVGRERDGPFRQAHRLLAVTVIGIAVRGPNRCQVVQGLGKSRRISNARRYPGIASSTSPRPNNAVPG